MADQIQDETISSPAIVEALDFDAVGADPDVRDRLIALADKQDDPGYQRWIETTDSKELRKAADEAVDIVLQSLYKLCQPVLENPPTSPKIDATAYDDGPTNAQIIMDNLVNQPESPANKEMRDKAIHLIKTLRWLKFRAITLALPSTVAKLSRQAARYFSADTTYIDTVAERAAAEELILAIPEIVYTEGSFAQVNPDTGQLIYDDTMSNVLREYVDGVSDLVGLKPDDGELWAVYIISSSNALFYFQLICDLLQVTQATLAAGDDDPIDLHAAFNLAPSFLMPLAAVRDEMLQTLLLPDEVDQPVVPPKPAAAAAAQSTPQLAQTAPKVASQLDVG